MVLPLVPLVLIGVGAVSGASGAALGIKGGYEIKRANARIQKAGARYDEERGGLEAHESVTNERLKALGARQEHAVRVVVERMADFLRRHEKQVAESEKLLVDGLDSTTGRVELDQGLGQDAIAWMRGIVGAAVTGVGINAGVTTAVTSFAAASTGTAISSLSGAAMTNATLAALGGGSVAAGGGGMAVGAAALNFVTVGPAILVGGLVVAGQGEKAKTKAREHEAEVDVAIAEMRTTKAKFDGIIARAGELETLLDGLVVRGVRALDLLESEPFDPAVHAAPFRQALALAVAVRDVASTQIVDGSGEPNQETVGFTMRYRTLLKEDGDG
ncbi:hypothetical protein [Streptomyces griseus]|uniref:hypothetical protein n=1 Tax=Streptomyces griseus TaxID=1911 RepID=UPI0004C9B5A2|nr:hypothetical protein [Streptomyces griseus]